VGFAVPALGSHHPRGTGHILEGSPSLHGVHMLGGRIVLARPSWGAPCAGNSGGGIGVKGRSNGKMTRGVQVQDNNGTY